MDIESCNWCGVRVIPTAEGVCPSCRRTFAPLEAEAEPVPSAAPAARSGPAVRWSSDSPSDDDNPYRSPQSPPDRAETVEPGLFFGLAATFWVVGRAPRWQWWLVRMLGGLLLTMLVAAMHDAIMPTRLVLPALGVVGWLIFVTDIRRWHDTDRSGFWWLVRMVPIVGPIYALAVLGFIRGTDGPNRFGDDPLRY